MLNKVLISVIFLENIHRSVCLIPHNLYQDKVVAIISYFVVAIALLLFEMFSSEVNEYLLCHARYFIHKHIFSLASKNSD